MVKNLKQLNINETITLNLLRKNNTVSRSKIAEVVRVRRGLPPLEIDPTEEQGSYNYTRSINRRLYNSCYPQTLWFVILE